MIPRLQLRVASHARAVTVIAAIVGVALIGVAGFTWMNPPVEEPSPEEQEVFTLDVTIDDSAVVEEESPLFEVGERLESRPAYFTNISPELDLTATITVPDDHEVEFENRMLLEERATRDGSVVWNRDRLLEAEEPTVEDGKATINTSINIPDLQADLEEIEALTDPIAATELSVWFDLEYTSTAPDGEEYTGTVELTPELEFATNAYWLEGETSEEVVETETISQEPVEGEPNPLVTHGFPALGLVLLLGAIGGVGWARRVDIDELRLRVEHDRYDDWISNGQFIADSSYEYVYVESLVDLINVGIDSDKRVIYDPEMDMYQVVDDSVIYYYATEPANIELWTDV